MGSPRDGQTPPRAEQGNRVNKAQPVPDPPQWAPLARGCGLSFVVWSDVHDAVSLKRKLSYVEGAASSENRFHIYLPIFIAANLKE